MSEKLKIIDSSKIKITKLKDWAIYFDYDSDKYLLHESVDGYDSSIALYKRIPSNDFGKYELEWMKSDNFVDIPTIEYNKKHKHWSGTYSQINIEKFVYDMTYDGYFSSQYDDEIKEKKNPIYQKKKEIERLQREIEFLEKLKGE